MKLIDSPDNSLLAYISAIYFSRLVANLRARVVRAVRIHGQRPKVPSGLSVCYTDFRDLRFRATSRTDSGCFAAIRSRTLAALADAC